jgi:2-polyprenyl-3-methyl-5-hydroxy-6-metoxy-1,4-benzoquinol methylase
LAEFAGGKLLDVGCNSGYNSLYAAARFGMTSTGIDVLPRHIEVSRFLSELAGIPADFLLGTAENFSRPEQFDLILHFGTLYHLPNPVLSLTLAFENLKPGGTWRWKRRFTITRKTTKSVITCTCKTTTSAIFGR